MNSLDHDRLCAGITAQTELFVEHLVGTDPADLADLGTAVPSCPGWNLAQLVRHVGAGHRWVEAIVTTRATEPPPDTELRTLSADTDVDHGVLAGWLTSGAARLAETLAAAGPDLRLWTAVPGRTSVFWARRFLHETVIHRADAALAVGAAFTLDHATAADGLDEWLELISLPQQLEVDPTKRELLGEDHTLRFAATDADTSWWVDATGESIRWSREYGRTGDATVTVRAPLTELLLLVYRRRTPDGTFDVRGETGLLDLWLANTAFG